MRIGACAGIDDAGILADSGYDYIELSAAGDLVPDEGDAAWLPIARRIEKLPLPVEAFNSFVRTGKITGPEADFERLTRYVDTALSRAAQVGGRIIVFGSAGARNVPAGFDVEVANCQVADFLSLCADASDRHGVTVVVEPLCRQESNIINLVSEGAALVRRVGRQGVRNLADTYHMEAESEPVSSIVDSGDVLAHAHTADTGRFAPGTGTYDHVAMFQALAAAGYDSRLSIECSWQGRLGELAAPALHHLKTALAAT